MNLTLITTHAPVTETAVDPTYIGCTCELFEAHVAPAQRPVVWVLHAQQSGLEPRAVRDAVAASAMVTETFAPDGEPLLHLSYEACRRGDCRACQAQESAADDLEEL
jgi:hypothetical protein